MKLSALQIWSARMVPRTAVALEALGYVRYWLSEHHGSGAFSGSPLLLTAIVAGLTDKLRTGPAGVLLHYHSALKVAEDVRMLELLFPGRIDLGIARAVEHDPVVASALLDGRSTECDFHKKTNDLLSFVRSSGAPVDTAGIVVPPSVDTTPEIWILGTSLQSARLAAELGACYSFSCFINAQPHVAQEALKLYRESFRPALLERPYCSVAMSFVCGDTTNEAASMRSPAAGSVNVVGSTETVYDCITSISDASAADEVVLVDVSERLPEKIASYGRIAERCGIIQSRGATAATL